MNLIWIIISNVQAILGYLKQGVFKANIIM